MKRRILITLVAHRVIEIDDSNYPKEMSQEEKDQNDKEDVQDDPFGFIDHKDTVCTAHITHLPNG